jgi:hypothetical protein
MRTNDRVQHKPAMAHHINGLLGYSKHLDTLGEQLKVCPPRRLQKGFSFLPLPDEALDRIFVEPGSYHSEFIYLSNALLSLLLELSKEQAIAYIETDYFGGIGNQSAVLAQNGRVVFGPARGPGSINRTLQMMGVVRTEPDLDEFDAVGLGWLRDNDATDIPINL